ncbi:MAG: hybrid sensor histidine kinase/response regulator, partial [Methanobacteriota archaeon]
MNEYILVAEDSKTQADILCHILQKAGYETGVAESGGEALSLIRIRMPDLLLTDIVMPGMDGYELCNAIKSSPTLSHLPVILVTQLHDPEDVIKGLVYGANNFIIKPYDPEGLLARISAVLRSTKYPSLYGGSINIEYNGTRYPILSDRDDILQILLSIYDTAVSRNIELEKATERLNILTGSLEELVEERTHALQRTTETVEQLLMQKNELITKIGHDLKTPLTPLVALLPYVFEQEKDSELQDILDVLIGDVQVLKGLVDQTIRLSLLNYESFSMIESEIPITKVIDEVISGYMFSIRQLNLSILNLIPPDCTVLLSPFHATTIFENLISNAIKYNVREGTITFRLVDDDSFWAISVTDTGIGLTSEEAEQVFDEFFKADLSRHDHSSHGLGLSIVHRVISMCKGTI